MKKLFFLSILCLLTSTFFSTAKNPDPFHLPASIPVPEWVSQVDWSSPNVYAIDKIIYQYKKSPAAHRAEEMREKSPDVITTNRRKEIEEPYETAYIRWRMQLQMMKAIQTDGSVIIDQNKYLQDLHNSLHRQSGTNTVNTSGNWVELGPIQSYRDNNAGLGYDHANVYSIVIAPSNDNILYCGTEDGAIFKTTDKGLHWSCVSNSLPANAPVSIAIDPADENIVYVRLSNVVLKSEDGGLSWTVLSLTPGNGEKIIVLPNSRVVTVGATAVFYSDDSGITWNTSTGISGMSQVFDVRANAYGSDTVYASAEVSNQLRIFTSVDGGSSFTDVTGSNTTVENTGSRFATSPADPTTVYCIALGNTNPPSLLKSTDGGFTWTVTVLATGTGLGGSNTTVGLGMSNGQGFYDLDIMADPTNSEIVIVATTSAYLSIDGGYNFSPLGGYAGGPIGMHVDMQCMAATSTDAYISSDGGVIHSTDFFSNAGNADLRNYGITGSYYWGFGQGWQEDITTGGRYHNGDDVMYSDNYGSGNSLNIGGGESGTGHVFLGRERTVGHNDMGVTKVPTSFAGSIQYNVMSNALWPTVSNYYQFHGKLLVHPWYRNVLYIGVDSILWRSNNSGQSYSAFKNFGTGDVVWRFEIARSNVNVFYVLTQNGIFKTADNGTTWSQLTLPVAYAYYNADIAVNPSDENEVYICMAQGPANAKVFKSTNGGSSWTNYTGTALNGKYIYALNFQGGTDGGIYATSQNNPSEMFYRDNTMSDWENFSSGLFPSHLASAPPQIFYRDNKIRLAGLRGIMESTLYTQGNPVAQAMSSREVLGCDKDTIEFYDYSILNYTGATWQWSFPGSVWVSSVNDRNPKVMYSTPGTYDVSLTVVDGFGHSDSKTFTGMVQFPQNYCSPDTLVGNCMTLSLANRPVNIGTVNLNSNTFSISTWVKPSGVQVSFAQLVGHYGCPGSPNYGFGVGITFSGYTPNLQLCYTDEQVNYSNYSGLIMDSTRWNNVVVTYSPTGVKLYLNGQVADVNTNSMPALDFTQAPFYINPDILGQNGYFRGQIDEVKFYNYTLSQDEVREKMHLIQSSPLSETGLIKYIQFNQIEPLTSTIFDVVNSVPIVAIQNTIVPSDAPVSTGTVYRNPLVNSAGLHDFPAADFKMYLPSTGTYPDGEMVAFHLRSNPDTLPDARPSIPGYFILNNYGTNSTYTSPDSLIFTGLKNQYPADEANEYIMYNRNSFNYGATWSASAPVAYNYNYLSPQNSELTWLTSPTFTSGGQYVIVKDTSLFTTIKPVVKNPTMELSVYPNPAYANLHFTLVSSQSTNATISLFDMKGACVINIVQKVTVGENVIMLPVQNLPNGVYEIVVGDVRKKVIID